MWETNWDLCPDDSRVKLIFRDGSVREAQWDLEELEWAYQKESEGTAEEPEAWMSVHNYREHKRVQERHEDLMASQEELRKLLAALLKQVTQTGAWK